MVLPDAKLILGMKVLLVRTVQINFIPKEEKNINSRVQSMLKW